ncbi:MAG: dynamin family protein [Oscillospiraceae bacterium]|nr:dynamin family protein [Oscillospiraceae bacterium]
MEQRRGNRTQSRASSAIGAARRLLLEMNKPELAQKLDLLERELGRSRFTVAVVGEFSRGKSTLINRLLERPVLPVGNMPTTAMLTRIRAGAREGMVYVDAQGRRGQALPIRPESWEGLVANNFGGPDPQGAVFMSIKNPWLESLSMELLDTPGAGDLEEKRAQKISDALMEADGAIIAISALNPMSMSEQQFIQQRLITRKTPFMVLAVTKLDEVPANQRGAMIQFIRNKLALWKMDIPVIVAGDVDVGSSELQAFVGIDKLRSHIASWVSDPKRRALTERWVLAKVDDVLLTAQQGLGEQLRLLELDADKRAQALDAKREQLKKLEKHWQELHRQMEERQDKCVAAVLEKAEEMKENTVQRLSHEVSRNSQPATWWRQEFGYRLRLELAGMAASLDALAGKQINEDLRWLNAQLDKSFHTGIGAVARGPVADKEMFGQVEEDELKLEDLDSKRNLSRIATTALTIIGSLTLSTMGLGMFNILCTSGVGTGSALLTEKFFKAQVQKQQEVVAKAIELQVPRTVGEAMGKTRTRLAAVYADILRASEERQNAWLREQNQALEAARQNQQPQAQLAAADTVQRLEALRQAIQTAMA